MGVMIAGLFWLDVIVLRERAVPWMKRCEAECDDNTTSSAATNIPPHPALIYRLLYDIFLYQRYEVTAPLSRGVALALLSAARLVSNHPKSHAYPQAPSAHPTPDEPLVLCLDQKTQTSTSVPTGVQSADRRQRHKRPNTTTATSTRLLGAILSILILILILISILLLILGGLQQGEVAEARQERRVRRRLQLRPLPPRRPHPGHRHRRRPRAHLGHETGGA